MYLCGFTLFLSLILNRTYIMILDTLRLEEKVLRLEGSPKAGGKEGAKLAEAGAPGEISRLRSEVKTKEQDIDILKKQVEQMQKEYNVMGDRVRKSFGCENNFVLTMRRSSSVTTHSLATRRTPRLSELCSDALNTSILELGIAYM